jgi:nucleoside-diphosphate-sugar epimerase
VKAFVTGGTGFLGRHLIEHLLAEGDDVTSLVRTLDRARTLPAEVRSVAGDVTRPASLRVGMRGADVVYHLAALRQVGVRPRDYGRLERINVEGTRAVLQLAGELGVGRVVFTSDLAAYGDTGGRHVEDGALPAAAPPGSAYGASKWQAHVAALAMSAQGVPVTIVAPGTLYGKWDGGEVGRVLRRYALQRLPVMLGPGSARSWTYAADGAAGHRLAATRAAAGETYLLAGPAHTWRAFLDEGERATGRPAPRLWVPDGVARLLARALARVRPGLAERLRAYSGVTHLGNTEKAERELGWRARTVGEGLRTTVDWLVAQEQALRRVRAQAASSP